MPNYEVSSEPVRIAGYDIEVSLTADHLWIWQDMAREARALIQSKNSHEAIEALNKLVAEMHGVYVHARLNASTPPR